MERKRGFLKVYLFIALILGIIGFIDTLLNIFDFKVDIYLFIISMISLLFFFFNIIAIPIFHRYQEEKIAYVLPLYHLISYLVFLILGIVLISLGLAAASWLGIVTIIIGFLTSFFEIGFSAYLLKRFEFI